MPESTAQAEQMKRTGRYEFFTQLNLPPLALSLAFRLFAARGREAELIAGFPFKARPTGELDVIAAGRPFFRREIEENMGFC